MTTVRPLHGAIRQACDLAMSGGLLPSAAVLALLDLASAIGRQYGLVVDLRHGQAFVGVPSPQEAGLTREYHGGIKQA